MALNYANLADTAERLIEENGRSMILRKGGEVLSDPAAPWDPDTTTGDIALTVIGVIVDYENDAIDGQLVMRGDKRLLVAENSVDDNQIELFDRVTDESQDWKIVEVTTWKPGDTRIFYDLQLRK